MIKTIAFMPRRADLSRDQFRDYYESRHAPLAIPLFPFSRYRRNHLADDAEPGFDCVSEFWIPSLERIGALMAGEVGDTMRADEREFLDQPSIVALQSEVALTDCDGGRTLVLLKNEGGDRDALVESIRAAGGSLEFLTPLDDRPAPFDALIRCGDGATPPIPQGWTIAHLVTVGLFETSIAA